MDSEALDAHAWTQSADSTSFGSGLVVRWLGTAGYALSYEDHVVLIDPYVTRLPYTRMVARAATPPDQELVDRYLPRADAVLLGHTHFDHAMDAPAVAQRDKCTVYGSASVATLLRLYGLESHATVVEPYRVYEIGPFEVTFVPSVHSKLALGMWVPNSGPITCDSLDHLAPRMFNCDQVWGIHIKVAGVSLYHQGSADLIDDAVKHRGIDYFLCGIAGRQFSPHYMDRVLRRLDPKVVIPNHYDNFFKPLTAPMGFTVDVGVARFTDEVAAVSRDFEIRSLSIDEPVVVPTGGSA